MREFKYDFVGDPAVFQDRRQPPHSDHRYLLPGGASPRLSLNGSWYFHYAENWAGAPEDDLPGLSGIATLRFCHAGRFLITAGNEEDAIAACEAAMEQNRP